MREIEEWCNCSIVYICVFIDWESVIFYDYEYYVVINSPPVVVREVVERHGVCFEGDPHCVIVRVLCAVYCAVYKSP